jgi:hypothetical protein
MVAILSTDAAASVGSSENLQYIPPSGSTLVGGKVDISVFANGHGNVASGATAIAYTPEFKYDGSDVFFQCAWASTPCGTPNDYSGVLELPADRGGDFYIGAGCGGSNGYSCNEGGSNGAWSLVELFWANFQLSNSSAPGASNISGTLLDPDARGTQELTLTANDPAGPGVYLITVQIDGKTLYTGTPNTNNGECVPVGSSSGALMFDSNQPCRESETVDLPINTTDIADGQHTLKVTIEDSAGNESVVYDGTISTMNAPANSTLPTIIAPSQVFEGTVLSTQPGTWSAPTGAGNIIYTYQWEDCNSTGENCQTISGAQNASYTPTPSDVGHTLRMTVTATDTDGHASAVSAATSSVLAAQESLGAPPGPGTGAPGLPNTPLVPQTPSTPTPQTTTGTGTGTNNLMTGSGTPNGSGASEAAVLLLGINQKITRSYARRAFTLNGRLLSGQGNPISGATLEILQQPAGTSSLKIIARVKTRSNGTFTTKVPGGPSRLIEVGYRAWSANSNYAARANINESVDAGVQLTVSPRRTESHGVIVLAGRVAGPIPKHGVIVELLVHYRGSWQPLRTPETSSTGRFKAKYQFHGASGQFPFRATVRAGQAAFPFATGSSKLVYVAAH